MSTPPSQSEKKVDNVLLSVISHYSSPASFVSDKEVSVNLSFEFSDKVRVGAIPIFDATFNAKVITVPDTSFKNWLSEQDGVEKIARFDGQSITWLPELKHAPDGFKDQRLGLLASSLEDHINKDSPAQKEVSFLGAQIPGVLFVYASPLLIIGFLYYLKSHIKHLVFLSKDESNQKEISTFPWIPLSSVKHWKADFFASLCILPVSSMLVLYFKIKMFEGIEAFSTILIFFCILVSIIATLEIFKDLKEIRTNVAR